MAEIVLREQLNRDYTQIADQILVRSAGVSSEEYGNPIDPRARRVLQAAGYVDSALQSHRAQPLHEDRLNHDLILAMTASHARAIRRFAERANKIEVGARVKMFRSFDPQAPQASDFNDESLLDLADPWYGGMTDFEECLEQVEAAMPQLIEYLIERSERA